MTETLDPRVGFSEWNATYKVFMIHCKKWVVWQFKREKIGPQFDFDIVRNIKKECTRHVIVGAGEFVQLRKKVHYE